MDIQAILNAMTLDEKLKMITGESFWSTSEIKRLGIPALLLSDGPHGLRKQTTARDHMGLGDSIPAISFPTAVNMASSWDEELIEEIGQALGAHCVHENISVLLGPGVNIKRSPLCGRNFEYFSEDPYLAGKIAVAWIKGVQSRGVGASLKHYALNNQETRRMTVNVLVDERAMHEIYLSAFAAAIKEAEPFTVMSAYNMVNGQYASENINLLHKILREKWGFQGLVVSDWGAVNNRLDGLKAGLDLEMPGSYGTHDRTIKNALKNGAITQEILDITVTRILELITRVEKKNSDIPFNKDKQHQLARRAAAESMVLLKNNKGTLPLKDKDSFLLIGALAKNMRYQGAGSSRVNPTKLPHLPDVLSGRNIAYDYSPGYSLTGDHTDQELLKEAVQKAEAHHTIVVVAGLTESYESEGFDREHLFLPPAQNKLITALSQLNKKMVVILVGGSPVTMPWLAAIDALLNAYLPGQAGAEAMADIILGAVNPCGKLAETYPLCLEDTPAQSSFGRAKYHQPYLESIYVGYRYYDKAEKNVLFPFGFGLSYTTFSYQTMVLNRKDLTVNEHLDVKVTVRNDGNMGGKEIVQLYVSMPESKIYREVKSLRAFRKIHIHPGKEKTVTFKLSWRDFAYYNYLSGDFVVEAGQYHIMAGSSSRHIHLVETVGLQSANREVEIPASYHELEDYMDLTREEHSFTLSSFKVLYNHPFPQEQDNGCVTINTPVYEMGHHILGRMLYKVMQKQVRKIGNDDTGIALMIEKSLKEIPLRSIVLMSQGRISLLSAEGFVALVNGKLLRGLGKILLGVFLK